MTFSIGVVDNCKNPESYGTICVKCNMCGRFDKPLREDKEFAQKLDSYENPITGEHSDFEAMLDAPIYETFQCPIVRYKPTNADRIRAMSDEELAKWLAETVANQEILKLKDVKAADEIERLQKELDAAKAEIPRDCNTCANAMRNNQSGEMCPHNLDCNQIEGDHWEWRGRESEEK